MNALNLILIAYGSLLLLWLLYVQVMAALRVWNGLHWFAKAHLLPIAPPFLLFDVAVNLVIGSLLFVEIPRWWTLSERLHHHATRTHGWRTTIAQWICSRLLNPFDPDVYHCGRRT